MEAIALYELIHNLNAEGYAYVAIGDTDHRDPVVRGLRSDINLFRASNEAGYTAFVLERPPEDRIMDDVTLAVINAVPGTDPLAYQKEVAANGEDPLFSIGGVAQAAFGMTAIYPDPRYSDLVSLELLNVHAAIAQSPRKECEDVFLQSYWNSDKETALLFEEEALSGNDIIAQRIQEQSGGRGLIVYGNLHFSGQHDLNEMLGEDKVAHIAAISSREVGYNPNSSGEIPDYPDYIYVIDEDAVIPFDFESPEIHKILENFTSSNIAYLDQATFDSCKAELTGSLKEHAVTQEQYEKERSSVVFGPSDP